MGALHVFTGPMFSGKSEALIRRIRRAREADLDVQVFVPSLDDRHGVGQVRSHAGEDLTQYGIGVWPVSEENLAQVAPRVRAATRVVAFDEAQFFGPEVVVQVRALLARNLTLYVAGLDRDYRDEPFGCMPQLLALADHVYKLTAICAYCKRDAARQTFRQVADRTQVLVGGHEAYAALCRPCYGRATDALGVRSKTGG